MPKYCLILFTSEKLGVTRGFPKGLVVHMRGSTTHMDTRSIQATTNPPKEATRHFPCLVHQWGPAQSQYLIPQVPALNGATFSAVLAIAKTSECHQIMFRKGAKCLVYCSPHYIWDFGCSPILHIIDVLNLLFLTAYCGWLWLCCRDLRIVSSWRKCRREYQIPDDSWYWEVGFEWPKVSKKLIYSKILKKKK